jgi:hypothetical protein
LQSGEYITPRLERDLRAGRETATVEASFDQEGGARRLQGVRAERVVCLQRQSEIVLNAASMQFS